MATRVTARKRTKSHSGAGPMDTKTATQTSRPLAIAEVPPVVSAAEALTPSGKPSRPLKHERVRLLNENTGTDQTRQHTTEAGRAVVPAKTVQQELAEAAGVKTRMMGCRLATQLLTLQRWNNPEEDKRDPDTLITEAILAFEELEPQTVYESMLAVQILATHEVALRFLDRTKPTEHNMPFIDANLNRATKLMRLHIEQLEAMAKLKGKSGQQRMVVEHVTIGPGGKASRLVVGPGTVLRNGRGQKFSEIAEPAFEHAPRGGARRVPTDFEIREGLVWGFYRAEGV